MYKILIWNKDQNKYVPMYIKEINCFKLPLAKAIANGLMEKGNTIILQPCAE